MIESEVIECFFNRKNVKFQKALTGNINSSYIVEIDNLKYVLQKINTSIFKNPNHIMKNVIKVTECLSKSGAMTVQFLKPRKPTCENSFLYRTANGKDYWRCMTYIDGITKTRSENFLDASVTGEAFGGFIRKCAGLDCNMFFYTIENFHNLPLRIDALNKAYYACSNKSNKVKRLYERISLLLANVDLNLRNNLPDRITHNDTKIENLIFNKNQKIPIVIDLDTVMPGKITDDFGDAARSVASNSNENESDIGNIYFDIEKFEAFCCGFFKGLSDICTNIEIEKMKKGAAYVTAELACRFLTDYLSNNIYFKIEYPEHNLVRAANQTELLSDIIIKEKKIGEIIEEASK